MARYVPAGGRLQCLTLLVAIPASGFLLRTHIVFRGCSHGSFMASKRLSTRLGVIVGRIVYSPFHSWRFVMFTLGPIWALAIELRFIPLKAPPADQRSLFFTDVALALLLTGLILLMG